MSTGSSNAKYIFKLSLQNRSLQNRVAYDNLLRASREGDLLSLAAALSLVSDDIDRADRAGKTALFYAVSARHLATIAALLDSGADVRRRSYVSYRRDYTAGGQLACSDEPPLVTAARVGSAAAVRRLLTAGAHPDGQASCRGGGGVDGDRTALHFACEQANLATVTALLEHGADVNVADRQHERPLHVAVRCRHSASAVDIVRALCRRGADVDAVNRTACSPLYIASFYDCSTAVSLLLEHGADVNLRCGGGRDNDMGTALHLAALKDRVELARLLIGRGARVQPRNALDCTPLQLNVNAHVSSAVASLLIRHGATGDGVDRSGYTLLGACVRNMRVDCESLAALAVYSGYDLAQDTWLAVTDDVSDDVSDDVTGGGHLSERFPLLTVTIPDGRVLTLCRWLRKMQRNPLRLTDLCRIATRRLAGDVAGGRSIVDFLSSLPLPRSLKRFVLLDEFVSLGDLYGSSGDNV